MVRTSVGLVFRLTESAVRNFKRIDNAITRMEKAAEKGTTATRRFNTALTATGVVAAVGLGLAVKQAADLEDALARLETVTRSSMQTVSTSLMNAEEAARSFATQYSASATEVIAAQFQLATAGVRVEEQIAGVQGAFKLATATVGDFTEATKLLGQFLNTFGKNVALGYLDPMTKVERITDILASTVQRFQVTLPVLSQGFKFIIGPARQLNLQLEEVSVALGILNTAGFRGTLAGTALSNMFNKLSRAVDKLDLDPSQFQDLEGNLISLASFLRAVNMALENTSPLEGQIKLIEVFDIRAGRVIKTLADNVDQLEKTANEFEILRGATERMATTIETTTSTSFKQFINSLQNIGTSIGKVVNEALRPFIRMMTGVLRAVGRIIESNKGFFTGLAIVTTGLLLTRAAIFAFNSSLFAANLVLGKFVVTLGATSIAAAAVAVRIGIAAVSFLAFEVAALGATAAVTALVFAIGALLAITVIGAVIVGVVIAIKAAVEAIFDLITAGDELGVTFTDQQKTLRRINEEFTDTASKARNLATEFERLGKAQRFGTISGGADPGDLLGLSKFAEAVRMFRMQGQNLDDAVVSARAKLGDTSILGDVAERLIGPDLSDKLTASFKRIIADIDRFDPKARDLSIEEKQGKTFKAFADAVDIATRSVVGDTQDMVDIFNKFSRSVERIPEIGKAAFGDEETKAARENVENIFKSIDQIVEVPIFAQIAKDIKAMGVRSDLADDQLQKLITTAIDPATDLGKKVAELNQVVKTSGVIFTQTAGDVVELVAAYDQYKNVVGRVRTITKRLDTAVGQFNKGLKTSAEALPKINELLAQLRKEDENLIILEKTLTKELERTTKAIEERGGAVTQAVQDMQEELATIGLRRLQIAIDVDRTELGRDVPPAARGRFADRALPGCRRRDR